MVVESHYDVAVVGGGLAGLRAALTLSKAGCRTLLLEKRPFLGGRAYSFREPKTGQVLDNGQHLMIGAYHATLRLISELGQEAQVQRQALQVTFAAGTERAALRCPPLPAPLHVAWGLLRMRGLRLREKWGLRRVLGRRVRGAEDFEKSVGALLRELDQSPATLRQLWEPIVFATLNAPLDEAPAAWFLEVLRRTLLNSRADSQLIFAKVGLSELFFEPGEARLAELGCSLRKQWTLQRVEAEGSRYRLDSAEESLSADRVVFALPPTALLRVVARSPALASLGAWAGHFRPSPIVSVNLWFENFKPEAAMLGLLDSPLHWLFDKSKILKDAPYLTLVSSANPALAAASKAELVAFAKSELQKLYPGLPEFQHAQIVKEQEATYLPQLSFRAPPQPPERVALAGDWNCPELPGTIESAVLSGEAAAAGILGGRLGVALG